MYVSVSLIHMHGQLCLDFDIETFKFLIIHKSLHVTNFAGKGGGGGGEIHN